MKRGGLVSKRAKTRVVEKVKEVKEGWLGEMILLEGCLRGGNEVRESRTVSGDVGGGVGGSRGREEGEMVSQRREKVRGK